MTTSYRLLPAGVLRLETRMTAQGEQTHESGIPDDPLNSDWQVYQEWLAAGNTPQPLQPSPSHVWTGNAWEMDPALQAANDFMEALQSDFDGVKGTGSIRTFLRMRPAEIDAYMDANIANAQTRNVLKILAKVVSVLARDRLAKEP